MNKKAYGFTIVELLIVIVIIGILAAISIVAYNGVQNQANDAAVQSDLANIAKKLELYRAEHGAYPAGSAELTEVQVSVSKLAYGNHFDNGSGLFNLVYCRPSSELNDAFALIAASKSGSMFQYTSESGATQYPGDWSGGSRAVCAAAGVVNSGAVAYRDWFYSGGAWAAYVH